MRIRFIVMLLALASIVPVICGAQTITVSPRIVWMDSYAAPRRSNMTGLAGLRVELLRTGVGPFAGISWRETEVGCALVCPSGSGVQFVAGAAKRFGAGAARPYMGVGAGMILWRNPAWGDPLLAELEAGLELAFSERWGLAVVDASRGRETSPFCWVGTSAYCSGSGVAAECRQRSLCAETSNGVTPLWSAVDAAGLRALPDLRRGKVAISQGVLEAVVPQILLLKVPTVSEPVGILKTQRRLRGDRMCRRVRHATPLGITGPGSAQDTPVG